MKLKKVIATGLFTAMLAGSCLSVSAAPATVNNLTPEQVSLILDIEAYKQAYPDLAAVFGDNTSLYVDHYLTHGIYEGRTKGVLFDPLTYAEAYGDIRAAFGYDVNALVSHYVNFGAAENRTMGTSHGYADIATAESSGMANYYIPRTTNTLHSYAAIAAAENSGTANSYVQTAIATNYENFVPIGNSASVGGNNLASTWDYDRSTAIYGDNNTLLRVEYYDANGKLIRYSDVDKVDHNSNSYTENIYYYDENTKTEVLDRVDTYVDGVLQSSVSGSN